MAEDLAGDDDDDVVDVDDDDDVVDDFNKDAHHLWHFVEIGKSHSRKREDGQITMLLNYDF